MHVSRRKLICGAAALGWNCTSAAARREVHRFRTGPFRIQMTVEYHDGYTSRGLWLREHISNTQFCLSAKGDPGQNCIVEFHGSLAIAQYSIDLQASGEPVATLRDCVRTVDQDVRLHPRPPFERTIELKQGIGSDLQAFGYEPSRDGENISAIHSPWYLFRQDLYIGRQAKPFLAIFWKHALQHIRVLDVIPGEETWPINK
jgi:hypothetical protein